VDGESQIAEKHRDGGYQCLDMTTIARNAECAVDARRVTDRDTHLFGGGVDGENLHRSLQPSTA
jgi:uncharacterized membrane-anchored protein